MAAPCEATKAGREPAAIGKVKVALAQISPVYMNREKTLEKVVAAIKESAAKGASIMATGEALVPGACAAEEFSFGTCNLFMHCPDTCILHFARTLGRRISRIC